MILYERSFSIDLSHKVKSNYHLVDAGDINIEWVVQII